MKKVQTVCLLGTIFLLPLIFNPWGIEAYESWKNSIFYIGIGLSLALLGWDYFKSTSPRPFPEIILFASAWTLMLVFEGLLVSERPLVSFFGAYPRHGGLLNSLACLGLFWAAWEFLKQKNNEEKFIKITLLTGTLVSIYGILQKLGWDILSQNLINFYEGRAFSTLGNPNAMGEFLIFPIFLCVRELYKNPKNRALWLILVVLLTGLLLSENRASILALLIVAVLSFMKSKKAILASICILILGIGGILQMRDSRSIQSHFELWKISTEIIQEQPLWGYGPENYSYEFERKISPEFLKYEDHLSMADRAHNNFLGSFINFGIFGALSSLALFIGIIYLFLKKTQKNADSFWIGALLATLISQQFSFFLVTSAAHFTLFLSFILSQNKNIKEMVFGKTTLKLLGVTFMMCGLLLSFWGMKNIYLDTILSQINRAFIAQDRELIEVKTKKVENFTLPYAEIHGWLAQAHSSQGDFKQAFLENKIQRKIAHDDSFSILLNAQLHENMNQISEAEKKFEYLYESDRKTPLLFQEWAEFEYRNGNQEKAAWAYQQLFFLLPEGWEKSRIFWKNHPEFRELLEHIKSIESSALQE